MGRMAINHIIPAALTYQRRLLKQISLMKDVFDDSYKTMAGVEIGLVREISSLVTEINSRVDAMVEARKRANISRPRHTTV